MKKRIIRISLFIILVAITILIVSINITKATEKNEYISRFYHEEIDGNKKYFVSVVVPSDNEINKDNNKLSQKKVKQLVETKYKKGIVKNIYKEDGETVLSRNENVGTGCIIELTTGRKVTVILYGDVNGDGEVNTNDTVTIAEYNVKTARLNDNQKKSAKLTKFDKENINTNDTVRVAYYNVNGLGTEERGKKIIDEELLPEDEEEIVDINTYISEINKNEDRFNIEITNNVINVNFSKEKQELPIKLEEDKVINLLEEALHNGTIKNIEISYKNNNILITKEDNKEEITNKISEILKIILEIKVEEKAKELTYYEKIKEELLNKKIDDLLTKELKVKINIEDTAKFAENQDGNYNVEFNGTLFLDKLVKEKLSILENIFTIQCEEENGILKNVNAEVQERSKKLSEVALVEGIEIIEEIKQILTSNRVSKIEISCENEEIETLELNKDEKISEKVKEWLEKNVEKIFNRQNIEDIILGDLDTKEIKIKVYTTNSIKLEDDTKEREYTVKFSAKPIKVTFNWNYDEKGENRTTTATMEHAGTLEEKDRPKYTVIEDGEEKDTDIRIAEPKKFKLLGWKKEDTQNEEYVKFEEELIEYDATYIAEWVEIDDIDTKMLAIIDNYNKNTADTNTGKDAFHISTKLNGSKFESIRVDILNSGKKLTEMSNTGLMVSMQEFLTTQNISKIKVQIEGNEEFSFEESSIEGITTDTLKAKILEILSKLVNGSTDKSNEITLKSLVGKKLTISINQSKEDEEFAKEYKIIFEEVITKDEIMTSALTDELKNGEIYKYSYDNSTSSSNGNINIEVMHSTDSLSNVSGTNALVLLNSLLSNEKVSDISIIYGENQKQSIKELLEASSGELTNIKDIITKFLSENWTKICNCNKECCKEGSCTWEKATNNCLIERKNNLKLELTLSEAYEFDKEDNKNASYDIKFNRSTVDLTLHFNNESKDKNKTTIDVPEGLPLVEENIRSKVPNYEKHAFKQWCKEEGLITPYNFNKKEKVTDDLELYAEWYNVIDTQGDISNKIKEKMQESSDQSSTIDDVIREEVSEDGKVIIKIEDETADTSKIYDTALANVIKDELTVEGVKEIKVQVAGTDEPIELTKDDIGNTQKKEEIKNSLGGDKATNKLIDVIGKNLSIEIYLDKEKAVSKNDIKPVKLYKAKALEECDIQCDVSFEGLVTKEKLKKHSDYLINNRVNSQKKVTITAREDGNLDATVKGTQGDINGAFKFYLQLLQIKWTPGADLYDTMAGAVAAGCGGKTALMEFFNKVPYISSLEFSNDENPSAETVTLNKSEAKSETDMALALMDIPTMLGGTVKSYMREFDGKHLNIKINLEDNWKFESSDMSEFIMNFHVVKNT